jgi:hypothetical protein
MNRKQNEAKVTEQNGQIKYETTGKITNNNRKILNNELATNDDAKLGAAAHEQGFKVDRPSFARGKYLVITQLAIATLIAQVFVMRHQMSCYRFLCLSSRLTYGLLKPT